MNETTENKKNTVKDVMSTTMERIKEMVDANTIVGNPITTADGITLIPISKITFGFASGGMDFGKLETKQAKTYGGGGAGVNIIPVAFLVISNGNVKVMSVNPPPATTVDRVVDMAPDLLNGLQELVERFKPAQPATPAEVPEK